MTFKMSNTNRTITIYNLSSSTNEFIGKGDGYIPANTGLPAYSTDIAPPAAKDGFVAVFDYESGKWSLAEDHRGKIVYNIHTGESITINQLGKLPDDVVSVAPEGHFVKWDGKKWVHDADAEKTAQITQATQQKKTYWLWPPQKSLLYRTQLILILQQKRKRHFYWHGKNTVFYLTE